jgi:hypothetical protein
MVARGDITPPAIIRSSRNSKMLLFQPELVLQQLAVVDSRWLIRKDAKRK